MGIFHMNIICLILCDFIKITFLDLRSDSKRSHTHICCSTGRIMTEKAKELGAEIYLETTVKSLIMEDGKCVGVHAVDKNGEEIEARAKAVVVATGGFGTNKEMIKENFGYYLWENFFPFNVPGTAGEGLNMMWEAGAQKYGANIEMIYQLKDNMNWFLMDAVLRQPNLLINQRGDRFMNEDRMGNTTFTGNAIDLQPGHYAYCIMDDGILKYYRKNGPESLTSYIRKKHLTQ